MSKTTLYIVAGLSIAVAAYTTYAQWELKDRLKKANIPIPAKK